MKINGKINEFYHYAFPMQAVLVTCVDEEKKTNVITIAWHTTISKDPPLYGISVAPSRYSHDLIRKSKEFVVNFTPYELVNKVHFCGTHSGRKTDKINELGLILIPSKKIKTPSIKECYAHFECKLHKTLPLGDHTLFVGEVLNIMIDKNAFLENLLDNKRIQPTYYVGGNKYISIAKSGKVFS
ncbi:MAG: flavin reductase family protein [Thermoplasmatales archaeon]|nr:MAG: flavin reductase family protein [Thermoplasmatales archaeon]